MFRWGDWCGENAGVSFLGAGQYGALLCAGLNALTGGFLAMMPAADSPQVGEAVIVAGGDVIYLSRSVPTAFAIALEDFTPSPTAVKSLRSQAFPVAGET